MSRKGEKLECGESRSSREAKSQAACRRGSLKLTRSSRQALAATRASRREDLAAADRLHTGAEAMTAFAHELARLISTLHDKLLFAS